MLRVAAISVLLTLTLCNLQAADYEFGSDEQGQDVMQNVKDILAAEGFSEEEIQDIISQGKEEQEAWNQDETYYSWTESKGYEDCEEFIPEKYRNKGSFQNTAEDGSLNDIEDDQYGFDTDTAADDSHISIYNKNLNNSDININIEEGNRRKHHHGKPHHGKHHHGKHHHGGRPHPHPGPGPHKHKCSKPLPLEVICAKYECPPLERLNSTGCGYETRLVYGGNWVATDLDDISDIEGSATRAFWRLFKYIRGENDQAVEIGMTVPVMYKWFMDENYKLTGGRMHFYIPSALQDNPPQPTDDSVEIDEFYDTVTYNRAFGGDAPKEKYLEEFQRLGKALGDAGDAPYLGFSITLEFTRPGVGRQRHEVMFACTS